MKVTEAAVIAKLYCQVGIFDTRSEQVSMQFFRSRPGRFPAGGRIQSKNKLCLPALHRLNCLCL